MSSIPPEDKLFGWRVSRDELQGRARYENPVGGVVLIDMAVVVQLRQEDLLALEDAFAEAVGMRGFVHITRAMLSEMRGGDHERPVFAVVESGVRALIASGKEVSDGDE